MIQNLTKAANPLGKLMNYLHEDLDAMYTELQMWNNTKKQLYGEIQKQKRYTCYCRDADYYHNSIFSSNKVVFS